MKSLTTAVRGFIQEEDGASASEYAVLVALVVVAVAAAVKLFNLGGIYTTVSTKVQSCVTKADGTC